MTDRQRQVFDFIAGHIAQYGWPPTLREIGAGLGIGSTTGVSDHIAALERDGWVERVPKVSRGLRILRRPS